MLKPRRISTGKAAEILGVCQDTIRRYIDSGRLPATRPGGRQWRIKVDDVEALASQSEDDKALALARKHGI